MRFAAALSLIVSINAFASDPALDAEAQALVAPFAGQLQATVKSAMQSGGAVAAVDACHTLAPSIADQHSKVPWTVGRTALKVRNPGNAPDDWEKQVLLKFESLRAAGTPLEQLRYGEKIGNEYRYMQAIGTAEVCLACHGQALAPDLQAVIKQNYPADQATGFLAGDLRGAFSLRKSLLSEQTDAQR
jgi:hypothetical protein